MIRIHFATAIAALNDHKGVTAAEYAILATGIIVAIGVALAALTPGLEAMFTTLVTKLPK